MCVFFGGVGVFVVFCGGLGWFWVFWGGLGCFGVIRWTGMRSILRCRCAEFYPRYSYSPKQLETVPQSSPDTSAIIVIHANPY